jgi:hypothetical protein
VTIIRDLARRMIAQKKSWCSLACFGSADEIIHRERLGLKMISAALVAN